MKKLLTNCLLMAVATTILLPATMAASSILTFSSSSSYQTNGSSITGTGTGEVATVNFTTLVANINGTPTLYSGSYVETYYNSYNSSLDGTITGCNNGDGCLSITGTNGISLAIDEMAGLLGTFNNNSVSLYSGVTSVTINSALLSEMGLSATPALAMLASSAFGITGNGNQVTSATAVLIATPEPASFSMLGLALLSGIGIKARRRFGYRRTS